MNNKLLILGLSSFLLNGCGEIYTYQPAAPIFKKRLRTNPYEQKIVIPEKLINKNNKTFVEPLPNQSKFFSNTKNNSVYRKNTRVKKATSPAIIALVFEADRRSRAGDLEAAVVTIERALRIDSRSPELIYKLAKLRLLQSKPRLAEDLAKKAALLSADNKEIKKKSWILISKARKKQKNFFGAKEAKLKADSL